MVWLGALTVLLGCFAPSWNTADDCLSERSAAQADECWAAIAPQLFRADRDRGEQLITEHVTDPQVADFIWLTVTREVDPSSYRYCERIIEPALQERCRVLVSRPHLHRELLKASGGGPSGGPGTPGAPRTPGAGGGPAPGSRPSGPPPGG